MNQPITEDEIDKAVYNYCDLAQSAPVPKAFANKPTLYFQAIEGLRRSERKDRRRRRLGKFLINRYRKDQAVQGRIDWDAFRAWLKEHMAEINFMRLIISILMFMLLL